MKARFTTLTGILFLALIAGLSACGIRHDEADAGSERLTISKGTLESDVLDAADVADVLPGLTAYLHHSDRPMAVAPRTALTPSGVARLSFHNISYHAGRFTPLDRLTLEGDIRRISNISATSAIGRSYSFSSFPITDRRLTLVLNGVEDPDQICVKIKAGDQIFRLLARYLPGDYADIGFVGPQALALFRPHYQTKVYDADPLLKRQMNVNDDEALDVTDLAGFVPWYGLTSPREPRGFCGGER